MPIAKYDLEGLVFPLLRVGQYGMIAPSRSVDTVILIFPTFGREQAEKYIVSGLLHLTESDFAKQTYHWGVVLDIYGKNIDGRNWFIKFFVEKNEDGFKTVSEVSFHPLEADLKLSSGAILMKEKV